MRIAATLLAAGCLCAVPALAQQPVTQSTAVALRDTAPPLPQEIVPIVVGQTRTGMLELGDHQMGDGTWCDIWYLQVNPGQRVVIELRSRAFDAYLQLLDPWGNRISDDDDGAGSGDARITFTAREAGRYQVVVNTFGDTPRTGRYTLAVR